jgi:hypothetical protein
LCFNIFLAWNKNLCMCIGYSIVFSLCAVESMPGWNPFQFSLDTHINQSSPNPFQFKHTFQPALRDTQITDRATHSEVHSTTGAANAWLILACLGRNIFFWRQTKTSWKYPRSKHRHDFVFTNIPPSLPHLLSNYRSDFRLWSCRFPTKMKVVADRWCKLFR